MIHNPAYHIDVFDSKAVQHYSRHFNCLPEEIIDAVHKVGSCTEEVRLFIQHKGYSHKYTLLNFLTEEIVQRKNAD